MDIGMNLINGVTSHSQPEAVSRPDNAAEAQQEQFARDFEGILLEKLLEEMKNTIGDWGFEKDAASQQVQGLFWMHLAKDMSANGGLGMWKEIQQSMNEMNTNSGNVEKLNEIL